MSIISNKLKKVKMSATSQMADAVFQLKAQGKNIISLSVGEPDFDTPDNIKMAANSAISSGFTKYTQTDGLVELKDAIIKKFKTENNLNFGYDNICVSNGGKQVIFNAFFSTLNKGDEVIIPSPYWVSYPDIITMCGGTPIIAKTYMSEAFKLTPNILKNSITSKTKWLILNSPNNPTGSVYSSEELYQISKVLEKYPKILIMTDDIYEHIIFDNRKFVTLSEVNSVLNERVLIVNGVSKAHAMTGWRIGYGAGPSLIVKEMAKVQTQSTSNPCSISQYAAIEALTGPKHYLLDWRNIFEKRRDTVVSILKQIDQIDFSTPEGSFYIFPSIQKLLGKKYDGQNKIENDTDFVYQLLKSTGVATVNGSAFGCPGHFRISFATSESNLKEACCRLKSFVSKIQ